MLKRLCLSALTFGAALQALPAFASFHLMQIEQVIGGVSQDENHQAIQLRMRIAGQNLVSLARIRAWDAAGANPVLIINFTTNVANANMGDHILIASPLFAATWGPAPDFIMTNLIPAAYLAAGKLTFEDDSGAFVYWSLAWGGAAYTGTNTGTTDNDADGQFNPPFGSALPSIFNNALRFNGSASALSTNNAADYSVTAGAAVFVNNAGGSTEVGLLPQAAVGPAAGGASRVRLIGVE